MNVDWNADDRRRLECVQAGPYEIRIGDHVRLRPKRRADVLDIALQGRLATIETIEVDFDNRCHLAVIVTDDPGADLGYARQVGHRFFFAPDEVEPVANHEEGAEPIDEQEP